jgi:glycosyltransferase involved in cell wall biosynthesis
MPGLAEIAAPESRSSKSTSSKAKVPRIAVCIVVENLPVPLDRRVWSEARALHEAGYEVSVICPKGKTRYSAGYEFLDGIHIYRHRTWEASSAAGYLLEYGIAWCAECVLALRVYAKTKYRILQGCNPPDNIFLIGLLLRPFGVRYIFDHHDLTPELFDSKFDRKSKLLAGIVRLVERWSFQTATVSIATNESFKEIAVARGKIAANRVFVVRNCPDANRLRPPVNKPRKSSGNQFQIVYVGFMARQDGLDLLLESIEYIVNVKQRTDVKVVLVGGGTMLEELKSISARKGLDAHVTFTGHVTHDEVVGHLANSDIGVAPDPKNPMNDHSTMIKIFEYMAFGLPVVQFDLKEGRRSAGPASLYAKPNDPVDFAERIVQLLDCPELREELGGHGRQRIEQSMNWETEKAVLLDAYEMALQEKSSSQ